MKVDLARTNHRGKPDINGRWWRYKVQCDICGSQALNRSLISLDKPNMEEKDCCKYCLRKFIYTGKLARE
jgi:hypothetical protein